MDSTVKRKLSVRAKPSRLRLVFVTGITNMMMSYRSVVLRTKLLPSSTTTFTRGKPLYSPPLKPAYFFMRLTRSLLTSTAVISVAPPTRDISTSLPPPEPMIRTFFFSVAGNNERGKYSEKLLKPYRSMLFGSPSNRYIVVPAVPST